MNVAVQRVNPEALRARREGYLERVNEAEQTFKCKYSLSDRARYDWVQPEARQRLFLGVEHFCLAASRPAPNGKIFDIMNWLEN